MGQSKIDRGSVISKTHSAGFSLVELMVAVGIVGIITAVAIPQYSKFSARGRQSAAKAELTAMYAAERNFHAEAPSYTGCLADIGANPTGAGQRSYYAYGYDSTIAQATCGVTGAQNCYATRWTKSSTGAACNSTVSGFPANARIDLAAPLTTVLNAHTPGGSAPTQLVEKNGFLIRAAGNISTGITGASAYDLWNIDSNKVLQNPRSGV